ncbi:MAG: tRNA (adenosine(37)-N6)-threonylcarbamoyltransferase complex ATPase subunit type 1 TsaE [Anaerolineales bacterium]
MPIWNEHHLEFFSHSPQQTQRIGIYLGKELQIGDLICLQGELGSGKTTFVRGLASGWGNLIPVSSPTFILLNEYPRADGIPLHHLDAYRIENLQEAVELDLETLLSSGPLVIEWAERISTLLPPERLWIEMEYVDEEMRRLWFSAQGERYDQLLKSLHRAIFGGD